VIKRTEIVSTIRVLIRETLLQESENLVSHDVVVAAIDNAIRPERLDITIKNFRILMIEIAIAESARDPGKHTNEMSGDIKGVFQISDVAIEQTQKPEILPRTKKKLNGSGALVEPWDDQKNENIFVNLKMQAMAACLYTLYLYYERANKPSLETIEDRAAFWKKYYNTAADKDGTVEHYISAVNKFKSSALQS
jgi:hypothetical protein